MVHLRHTVWLLGWCDDGDDDRDTPSRKSMAMEASLAEPVQMVSEGDY